jgi:hypothetical protein
MKFDDLDAKMRVFETASDVCVLPEIFMVARLDGRSFTRLTKEKQNFEAPFDERFRDLMVVTTEHVMDCGFRIVYGYTQSDEISVLFHRDEQQFQRKLRKLHSVLAGEASAKFSLVLGDVACFDCRISQLPTVDLQGDCPGPRQNVVNLVVPGVDVRRALGDLDDVDIRHAACPTGDNPLDMAERAVDGLCLVTVLDEGLPVAEPPFVAQHHRGLHLPLRDRPVLLQQPVLLFRRDQPKPMLLVESDGPSGGSPCADQYGPGG